MRLRLLTLAIIFIVSTGSIQAQSPIPDNIVDAWEAAGAKVGWIRVNEAGVIAFLPGKQPAKGAAPGDLPGFQLVKWKEGALRELAAPPGPFGLSVIGPGSAGPFAAEMPAAPTLKALRLATFTMTDASLVGLAGLDSVTTLQFIGQKVTDNGLKDIGRLRGLESLTIGSPRITDSGLEAISGLTKLKNLNASCPEVTDAGLAHLAKLKDLERLNLSGTKVTDAGLKALTALAKLKTLLLERTAVSDAGIAELKKTLPQCNVTH